MSQRDVLTELQAARVTAPDELRERVRLVAAEATPPRRRITWRRALVVALPVAAAVVAALIVTRPSHQPNVVHGQALQTFAPKPATGTPERALVVPSTKSRVQTVGTTLSLRIPTAAGVSDAIKRATQITSSLSGYVASIHATTHGDAASADLTLKIPRVHVQQAMTRLARLGTISSEQISVTDRQAGLNATDRQIARLRKQLVAAPPGSTLAAALKAHIERLQRAEAQTRRTAHYATVKVHLATPARVVHTRDWWKLAWAAAGAILLALVLLAIHFTRHWRETKLLSRR